MLLTNTSTPHQEGSVTVETATYAFFAVLSGVCLATHQLALKTKSHVSAGNNEHFRHFQRRYFVVYFLAMFGDWLQGPYVYKLYSHYGFVESQIAALYVAGFGASVIFGTITGSLADRFGRKRMCIIFCLLYSLCCLTKISSHYYVLMLGRVLGGISTSLLFSSFESWYVHEHIQTHDFPKEWISLTFSKATFWNGVLAIGAGILANAASEWLNLGPVSPFLMAVPLLLLCGLVVSRAWRENYGDTSKKSVPIEGLRKILEDEKILFLGIIQSLFESVMYVFVFLWTPVLDPAGPPLGLVFSVFMICIMIGSSLYRLLTAWHVSSQQILQLASVVATLAMAACTISTNPSHTYPLVSYIGFLLLELSLGMYFPAIGYLKSQIIPEMQRANIMNWLRVPLNIFACSALLWLHSEHTDGNGNHVIFAISTVAMFIAVIVVWRFCKIYRQKGEVTLM